MLAVQIPVETVNEHWRDEPGPLDGLTFEQAGVAVRAVLMGLPVPKPVEPPPPLDWTDWPRSPEEAARRIALEYYDIEATDIVPDDMGRWITVRGNRVP